jgi:hypothetical protein
MAQELQGVAQGSNEYFAYFDPSDAGTYLNAYHQLDKFVETEGPFDGVYESLGFIVYTSHQRWCLLRHHFRSAFAITC